MRGIFRIFIIVCVLTAAAVLVLPVSAQIGGVRYFSTGKSVRGDFLEFYNQAPDPLVLFGYPITNEFIDPLNHWKTQYFQRARLDLVNVGGVEQVRVAPLGSFLYEPGAPIATIPINDALCRTFPATQISVCYNFLNFYDTHAGARYLGNPISGMENRNGRFVQYFENARLEWQPDADSHGGSLAVSDLGRVYYDTRRDIYVPTSSDNNLAAPELFHAHAFVSKALLPAQTSQMLSVIVQDDDQRPIANALVSALLILPDGTRQAYNLPETNADGICRLSFLSPDLNLSEVVSIEVYAEVQGMRTQTATWFRIWW